MYRTFEIKNFRCFDHLKLDDLKRVNLIGGKNNVGKTALLEALYLYSRAFNPEYVLDLETSRRLRLDFQRPLITIWDWIFNLASSTKVLEFNGDDTELGHRLYRLRVVHEQEELSKISLKVSGDRSTNGWTLSSERLPSLALDYSQENNPQKGTIYLTFDILGRGSLQPAPPPPPCPVSYVLSQGRPSAEENAARFTRLVVSGKQDLLLQSLGILEPRLRNLSLLIFSGEGLIHGEIGIGRPIPLNYMGEGVNRLANFIMAISDNGGGVVLIDEIENGLHYSVLKDVWKAIGKAAREFNTQVFATTHSWECIIAAHRAFSETEYDFRYHRLDRTKEGTIRVVTYDEESLEAAKESDFEVR